MKKIKATHLRTLEQRLFWFGIFCAAALMFSYLYFVSASIVNVVLREETEVEILDLHASISDLETRYLLLKNSIDHSRAASLGFTDITRKEFVVRKSLFTARAFLRE